MKNLEEWKLSSNIRKLTWIKFFQSCAIIIPVMTLFFQDNGLSLSEIFLLQSVFAIAVFIFEVPTWYFGDRFGTKRSILIGSIFISIGFLLYAGWTNFMEFALCEIILAFWYSCISWSDSALLYDTLNGLDRTKDYKKVEWRLSFIAEGIAAIAWIAGGLIAHYFWFRVTMLVQGIIISFAIPFVISLVSVQSKQHNSDISLWQNIWNIIVYSLHDNKKLKRIIAYTSILSTASLCIVWAAQPYLQLIQVPVIWFGFVWFGLRAIVSITSLFAHAWDKKLGLQRWLLGLLGFGVAGYLIAGLNPYEHNIIIWIIIWLFWLSLLHVQRGLQKPISNHAINELAESHIRATVLSVHSMIWRLGYAILWPFIWRLWDLYDLQTMFILSAWIFGILGLLAFYKLFHSHKTK